MLSGKKKQKKYKTGQLDALFKMAVEGRVVVKIASAHVNFTAQFLAFDKDAIILENPLSHLEDVRGLRHRKLNLIMPLQTTLVKGDTALLGLTTWRNVRALQLTRPASMVTDEKRTSFRVRDLPPKSSVTFSTLDMDLYQGRVLDISLRGLGLALDAPAEDLRERIRDKLTKGTRVHADALLGDSLKLSFDAELRYNEDMAQYDHPGVFKVGMRMLNLSREAMSELHQWIFKVDASPRKKATVEVEPEQNKAGSLVPREKTPDSILVISSAREDFDFWNQCLGRKYQVIGSDFNMTNIRQALLTGPQLALVYLDPRDSSRASFTRKLCSSFMDAQAIMFFGEEPDEERRRTLAGSVKNLGFLDTSERKVLAKFRQVARVMHQLKKG